MKFEVRHAFQVTPEVLWRTLFSPDYEVANAERSGLPRETLSDETVGGKRVRRHRVAGRGELPPVVARALGNPRLTYELVEEFEDKALQMTWEVIPSMIPEKVKAVGSYEVTATPDGCERLVKGEISVAIPLLGGKIERAIGEELQSSYEKNIDFVRSWLEEHA